MNPAIAVENLIRTYGSLTAVDSVSFEVRLGEILKLIGPNGAGKTTLLECLEGLRTPSGGTLRVLNTDPARRKNDNRFRPKGDEALRSGIGPRGGGTPEIQLLFIRIFLADFFLDFLVNFFFYTLDPHS